MRLLLVLAFGILLIGCKQPPNLPSTAYKMIQSGDHQGLDRLLTAQSINSLEKDDQLHLLILAIKQKDVKATQILLSRGVDPNGRHPYHLLDPLNQAMFYKSDEIVKLLLRYGADPKARGALDFANEEELRWFLAHGADPNGLGFTGKPLIMGGGSPKELKRLLDAGADPNTMSDGTTPLHQAAARMDVESAKLLIKYGANKRTKNRQGQDPYETVGDLTTLLKKYGAKKSD